MGGWGGMGWLGPVLGLTVFVGALGLLALGAVWLARRSRLQPASAGGSRAEPLDLARRRLAAGEITVGEFREIRERLDE